eukprot:Gb_36751 [translate_table: standard]
MIKEQFLDHFQILRNPSTIYKVLRGIKQAMEETVRNYDGRVQVLVPKLKGNNPVPQVALMNYFMDGMLLNCHEKTKRHPMRSYEQVRDLAFKYKNQVETKGDPTRRYYVGGDPTCWNINRGDPKPKETSKSKEAETIEKLTTEIERMRIKLNEKGDANEKQSKKIGDQERNRKTKWCHICDKDTHNTKQCYSLLQNKPNNPRYKGKSEEGSKNMNYQAAYENDIPMICCPHCMTWRHDAKNCPHKDFEGAICMHCGPDDHKSKDCPRKDKTSNLFIRTPDNEENYDVNICTRSGKKTHTKQADTNFPNPKKEKDRFIVAKEALEAVVKEAQAKREAYYFAISHPGVFSLAR